MVFLYFLYFVEKLAKGDRAVSSGYWKTTDNQHGISSAYID
jgi:hypothetical protein